jgi:hypothetical protein
MPSGTFPPSNPSRAAFLCFGGWGLQTMLHVWPRLRLIQEERQALGIAGSLPDLDRLTAFAALMPVATVGTDGQVRLSVEALRPNPARYPLPGYLEEPASEGFRTGQTAQGDETAEVLPTLTESELLAARLLRRVRTDGYVQSLPLGQLPSTDMLPGDGGPTRAGMFRLGRDLAPEIARSLVWGVIDATRLDNEQTNDEFVQTTIYIIASLAEPLTSALMWPVLREIITQLGRRQIARVIGLLATGSFAQGRSRLVEEAASHAALQELEALMGGASGAGAGAAFVRQMSASEDGQAAERPAGPPVFDRVYFLDREKSNQALASSPLELSVLAGNAVEALLAAGGAELMDKSRGSEDGASTACRYAILGAASDTIPVAEFIAAAIAAEQKQALRAEVLVPGPQTEAPSSALADLGISPEEAVACALAAGPAGMFETSFRGDQAPGRERNTAARVAGVRIARDALLPPATAGELRRAKTLKQWRSIAEQRLQEASADLDRFEHAAECAWGLRGAPAPTTPSLGDESQAPCGGDGLVQRAAAVAAAKLAEDICREPQGILLARSRVAGWSQQVRSALAGLEGQTAQAQPDPPDRGQMARWQRNWAGLTADGGQSTAWASGAAAGGLVLLASWALVGWFLSRALPSPTVYQLAAAAMALVLAALGSAFVGWAMATRRVRGLKRRWQSLAFEHLNWHIRRQQQFGLSRVYQRLEGDLAALQEALDGAISELTRWTASDGEASEPPAQQWTHLRRPHASEQIWQETQARISQASAGNEKTRVALRRVWQAVDVNVDVDVDHSAPEPDGCERDPSRLVQAILRAQTVGEAEGIFTGEKAAHAGGRALAGALRRYAALATDYLCPTQRLLVDYGDLVRRAALENGIEKALLGDGGDPPLVFLEDLYARAKPAASYEITSTLVRDSGDFEFGVTPEGTSSHLQRAAEQRGMPLLASHDPLSVSLVRITGQLALQDLALFERGRRLYRSMRQEDRDALDVSGGVGS